MVSRVSCRVIDRLEIGSYTLYVGQATEAEVFGSGEVLTLNAYAARGKAVPPTATVYREMVGGRLQMQCLRVHPRERNITR